MRRLRRPRARASTNGGTCQDLLRSGYSLWDTRPGQTSRPYLSRCYPPCRRPRFCGGASVERDDDLAGGAALLDVGQRLEGLVEREGPVDDRAEVAGVVERAQLTQLGAVGLHEQEQVAHASLPGLLADLSAQQPHQDADELRRRAGGRTRGPADQPR